MATLLVGSEYQSSRLKKLISLFGHEYLQRKQPIWEKVERNKSLQTYLEGLYPEKTNPIPNPKPNLQILESPNLRYKSYIWPQIPNPNPIETFQI